jgi:lipocalin
MKPKLLILLSMATFLSCKTTQDLSTVEHVEIQKYLGLWYEIARLPNNFEKGLECVTATYTLKDNGKIQVLNKGHSINKENVSKSAKGTAWVPDDKHPGRLKVTFFWPFSGNYYIMALDENYQYALVGDPSRKYLWILSRTRALDDDIYAKLMDHAREDGFDIDKVIRVDQSCE